MAAPRSTAFTVILGHDRSDGAGAALQAAAAEVRRAGGATVVVVHSYESPEAYATPVGLEPPPSIGVCSEDQRQAVRQAIGQVSDGAVACLRELGAAAEGSPPKARRGARSSQRRADARPP